MKTNLPEPFAWFIIFFLWVYSRFLPNLICKYIYVSFEGLAETCEGGIMLEFSAFETLYGGQFGKIARCFRSPRVSLFESFQKVTEISRMMVTVENAR